MADANEDKRAFSRRHAWALADSETHIATIGISDYLAETMGAIVSIELPEVGDELDIDTYCLRFHLEKKIHSLRSPLSGRVVEINDEILDNPNLLSLDANKNWLYKMEYDDEGEMDFLMDANRYGKFIDQL